MIIDGPRRPNSHRPSARPRLVVLAAGAVGLLALFAGCSGSGGGSAKNGPSTVPSTQSPATFSGGSTVPLDTDSGATVTVATTAANPDLPGDPLSYAKKLFTDWKSGDQAGAGTLAAPAAVTALFAKKYTDSDDWSEPSCVAAKGVSTCTWTSASGRLEVKITNAGLAKPGAVTTAAFKKA